MVTITVTSPSGGADDERDKLIGRPLLGPLLFLGGSMVGGLILGLLVGLASRPVRSPATLSVIGLGIAAVYAADRLSLINLRPPSTHWQVPRHWTRFGRLTYSGLFGLALGFGLVTIITSWSLYALIFWASAQPTLVSIVAIFAVFGLIRGLPLLIIATGYHLWHFRTRSKVGTIEYFHGFPLLRARQMFGHLEGAAVAFAAGASAKVVLSTFTTPPI